MRLSSPSYPLSLPALLLLGFALVAAPPVLALLDAYFSLNRISHRSETAILRATEITRDSRALSEHLTALERLARQQLVLGDVAGLVAYDLRRQAFLDTTARLGEHAASLDIQPELNRLAAGESAIQTRLREAAPREASPAIGGEFASLGDAATRIVGQADRRIEQDIAALQREAATARAQLLHLLWILVPGSLVLAVLLTVLIRQPFRQLEDAMRGLGEGRFDTPLRVSGPSDMVRLGQRLDWLRTRLRALDAQKTRLLHHVSHELKTPLTALTEGIALLQDKIAGPLTADQREVVSILASNCQRLRRLIENLLDYSGLRAGPAPMRREPVAPAELLARVAADHKLAASARGLLLQIVPPPEGARVLADRDKIRVIIDNFLSNAIKYAPAGSTITLAARMRHGHAEFEVGDNGPGIAPELVPELFDAFVQGPAPADGAVKGSGLGLSIARELAHLHGGRVDLLPNPPRGTLARLSLPASDTPS
ncbi:MAG: HAMP domain-containing sensor histidine kinase [Candidatus Dactylopiibacterium sp.]|nr:HAMP domain-containing sensor histidine kinase [Candidatus Dactylopiibacterium sp.]